MGKTAILKVNILGDAKSAQAAMGATEQSAGRMSGVMGKLGSMAKAGLVAAGAAIVAAGIKSVSAASDLEQSMGGVDAVFKKSAGQMHKYADTASTTVGISKNEYNELATVLGSQLKNGGTSMDQLGAKTNDLIKTGADLSAMFGGSTKDAVDAISSALKGERDPIEKYGVSLKQAGIDAEAARLGFHKVGGTLSNEATQAATLSLIMKQTGDAHGAFGRESDTAAHQAQVFKAQLTDLGASVGTVFLPALTKGAAFLTTHVMPAVQSLATQLGPLASTVGGVLTSAWSKLTGALSGSSGAASGILAALRPMGAWVTGSLVPALASLGHSVAGSLSTALGVIGSVLSGLWARLQPLMPQIRATFGGIGAVITGALGLAGAVIRAFVNTVGQFWARWGGTILGVVTTVFGALLGVIRPALTVIQGVIRVVTSAIRGNWSGVWAGMKQIVTGALGIIKGAITGAFAIIRSVIGSAIRAAVAPFRAAWGSLRSATSSGVSQVLSLVRGLPGRIVSALAGIGSRLYSVGRNIVMGMVHGITGAVGSLMSSARQAVNSAISAAKSALGIHSPSRVFAEIGAQTVAGFTGALDDSHRAVSRAGAAMVGAAVPDVMPAIPAPTLTPSGRTAQAGPTVNITVNGALDPRAVADQIRRLLASDARLRGVMA